MGNATHSSLLLTQQLALGSTSTIVMRVGGSPCSHWKKKKKKATQFLTQDGRFSIFTNFKNRLS